MKSTPAGLFGLSLVVVLALTCPSRAEQIYWYSTWSNSPAETDYYNSQHVLVGQITLSQSPTPTLNSSPQNQPGVTFAASSTQSDSSPLTVHIPLTLNVTVYDGMNLNWQQLQNLTPQQVLNLPNHTFTFTGELDGVLSATRFKATAFFDKSGSSQSYLIGTTDPNFYTVSLPDCPGSLGQNSYAIGNGSNLTFTIETGTKILNLVPEPGSLLLSMLGVPLCALPWWRRIYRRRAGVC